MDDLPDPTADLHWSSYDRGIHEVFAANARAFPERDCVIETTPERHFSYKQISEASNVISHHLIQRGVKKSDVVMIYAHRGVDLVCAVMGVLAAGATMSVIDPLYPPDRQIVYLDVAKPRAVLVIKKAVDTAGGFSPKVASWIADNLELKTAVPSLMLQDDGEIRGGPIDGQDAFHDAQALKTQSADVIVGPDDFPTLSFTSGSEGKPKGVRGRHFSLVHYFPWMAERFGLSENDRFTMLSGIAHDPIQRDMFTPLFLGASLWVPSSEDIQHELLAEWMCRHKTTVTHLTPAMGQILVGGAATQFPALRNAFFVGDVLLKRDVRKLQDLAPNCTAINMFGTTETSRAVSYYAVKSRHEDEAHLENLPDVIPAGKGMKGVQLLVVNREDRTKICPPGQIGEVYVRAAGLAEGYLGLDAQTKEKFVETWFVDNKKWVDEDRKRIEAQSHEPPWRQFFKGPRDRLYRSGDLGRYTDNMDVIVTGRADNQVKLRGGFRFELGEIDSLLSSHPLCDKQVTIVRRDQDGENMMCTYVVPDSARWKQWTQEKGIPDVPGDVSVTGLLRRYRALREDLKKYLKAKVPDYAVPSMIIPLERFALNPNGKVDRPALPVVTLAEVRSVDNERKRRTAKLSATESTIAQIWSTILEGIEESTIGPDDSWIELGGNSIKAFPMLKLVREKFEGVQQRQLYQHPTLREFSRVLETGGKFATGDKTDDDYSRDALDLVTKLPKAFDSATESPTTILLTGATGFLGSFILANFLRRPHFKVFALVRGQDETGHARVIQTCKAYGLWSNEWLPRLQCISGDLESHNLGIEPKIWQRMTEEIDAIVHNGARVDWLLRYTDLRASNVLSTFAGLELCATGKAKRMTFVSSTAVLDNDHYLALSKKSPNGILESDDLTGSATGLDGGYAQSKWSSEYLMREAGARGLIGAIVRPGYILGDSTSGVSITDDFLIRMLKGCVQVGSYPQIQNTINMVPVDHVARIIAATTLHAPVKPLGVANVTPHPRLSWTDFLGSLAIFGYPVVAKSFEAWKQDVLDYVVDSKLEDFAVLPLLDLITTTFPESTSQRHLDDRNTSMALKADGIDPNVRSNVTQDLVGLYVSYLTRIGFMGTPLQVTPREKKLPRVAIDADQLRAIKSLSGRR